MTLRNRYVNLYEAFPYFAGQIHENDRSVCKGTVSEMRTFGGEVAFICAMIVDSLQLRERYSIIVLITFFHYVIE